MADVETIFYRVGAPVVVGIGAGILGYFGEDALVQEINAKKWVLPIIAGFAAAGATYIIMRR